MGAHLLPLFCAIRLYVCHCCRLLRSVVFYIYIYMCVSVCVSACVCVCVHTCVCLSKLGRHEEDAINAKGKKTTTMDLIRSIKVQL